MLAKHLLRTVIFGITCLYVHHSASAQTTEFGKNDPVKTEVYQVGQGSNDQYIAFLHDPQGNRLLPIWIGPCEATAIWRKLHQKDFPRPLTHDLFQNVLEATGVRILSILVDELRSLEGTEQQGTYFAVLTVQKPDGSTVKVDARPSDSMALAVRVGLPVYVVRTILDKHSIQKKDEPARPAQPPKTPQYY